MNEFFFLLYLHLLSIILEKKISNPVCKKTIVTDNEKKNARETTLNKTKILEVKLTEKISYFHNKNQDI